MKMMTISQENPRDGGSRRGHRKGDDIFYDAKSSRYTLFFIHSLTKSATGYVIDTSLNKADCSNSYICESLMCTMQNHSLATTALAFPQKPCSVHRSNIVSL